jgi:hypothetical protein
MLRIVEAETPRDLAVWEMVMDSPGFPAEEGVI